MGLKVTVRSEGEGHWVEWTRNGESACLGPYVDAETAEKVRLAKEIELTANDKPIDEA